MSEFSSDPDERPVIEEDDEPPAVIEKTIHILWVQEDALGPLMVKRHLKKRGVEFIVHHVRDGMEVMDYLERKGRYTDAPRPDLVILDEHLRGVETFQLLGLIRIQQWLNLIPVVIKTKPANHPTEPGPEKKSKFMTNIRFETNRKVDRDSFRTILNAIDTVS